MKNLAKAYAAIRLISLVVMGATYAAQDHEDFRDEFTDHRQIMIAPVRSTVDELKPNTHPQSVLSKSQEEVQKKHPLRVLALGGGGTRGVGSAEILSVLETYVFMATGKKLHEFFDVIVGTSTGGIQAIGLSMGLSAEDLKDLYQKNAKEIFKINGWGQWLLGGIWGPSYDAENLTSTIKNYMGENKTLNQALTHVAVTVYDDQNRRTHLLTNEDPTEGTINYNQTNLPAGKLNVEDAIRATAAAPTFFEKKAISDEDLLGLPYPSSTLHSYVDGGVSANDPSALAKAYAHHLFQQGVFNENYSGEIQLISIGTGKSNPIVLDKRAGMFGFGSIKNIPSYFTTGAEAEVYAALSQEMKEEKDFFHIQFKLPYEMPLDTTDEATLNTIIQQAHLATETNYFKNMVEILCGRSTAEIMSSSPYNKMPQGLRTQPPLESLVPMTMQPMAATAA